jgi:endothelin-converting enzyme
MLIKVFKKTLILTISALTIVSFTSCNDSKNSDALASGIYLENMDSSIRPQDDFYNYVNGSWQDRAEIPSDKNWYGSISEVRESVDESLKNILQELAKERDSLIESNEKIVGDFYISYMDTNITNTKGISPLQDDLDSIASATTDEDVIRLMADLYIKGISMPFGVQIFSDDKNSTQNITYIGQSSLGLPDKKYYSSEDEVYTTIRDKYKSYITSLMKLSGYENSQEIATDILELEIKLSAVQWSREANDIPEDIYNKYRLDDAKALFGDFDFNTFLSAYGLSISEMIIMQPSYIEEFSKLFAQTPVSVWREYLAYKYIDKFGWYLSDDFVDLEFDFFSKTLNGTEELSPREDRAVNATNSFLGEMLGQLYVKRYFSAEAKAKVQEMTQNILNELESSINELEWMGETTKQAAIVKLNKITTKIGYPDVWKDYTGLEIKADDLVGNIIRYNVWSDTKDKDKLGTTVDKSKWLMTPQTVNAYYAPYANEIVFPAALLQPPFFDINADNAVNYGSIGAIIGHELTHAIDNYGSQYDGDGNLQEWWEESDKKAFEELGKKLIAQYDAYKPFEDDNTSVNGTLTLGENIADLGGVNIAYRAYKKSLSEESSSIIDGLSQEQRFFVGYAQIWRSKIRDEFLRDILLTDPHLPGLYRINGVVINMSEFYEAFDVKEGDRLYKTEEDRIKIW